VVLVAIFSSLFFVFIPLKKKAYDKYIYSYL
jgi:hypothetical protein